MKKIYVQTPFGKDANSFWRCMGPLGYLAKQSQGEIQLHVPQDGAQYNWSAMTDIDLLFLHRPCRPDDLIMMQIARNMGVPVWIDYDDWLFHLPDWNPNKAEYHRDEVQRIMATCIACADIVTTSTKALAAAFLELNPHTVLLPNAYRSDLFPFRSKVVPDRKPIYVWRGTSTHEGDLLSVKSAITLLKEKIHFLGFPPYSLLHDLNPSQYVHTQSTDAILYWRNFYNLCAKVMLFPLYDTFFNRCKSNIAWMESIHAGALCVAPNGMDEWRHPGVVGYDAHDPVSFLDAAESTMAMDDGHSKVMVADAYDYIRFKYDISVINNIRLEILNSMFSPGFARNAKDPYNQLTGIWALSVLKKEPLPRVGDNKNEKQSV